MPLSKFWFNLHVLLVLLSFVTLYVWIAVGNDYVVFDKSVFEFLQIYVTWSVAILYLNSSVFVYFLTYLVYRYLRKGPYNKVHKVLIITFLWLGSVGFCAIFAIWKAELVTVKLFFQITSPHLGVLVLTATTVFLEIRYIYYGFFKQRLTRLCLYTFYLLLLFFPLLTPSPCIRSNLRAIRKPLLLGHKGFPKIAPENTRLSFDQALLAGVDGFEGDIAISKDGTPFLMHDSTLMRTTNVAQVFPERKYNSPESFSWAELQSLDAGSWYLESDPYKTVKLFGERYRKSIKQQKIMPLMELAKLAQKYKRYLMFDYRHPLFVTQENIAYIKIIVDTLIESGIDQSLVWWISGANLAYIKSKAPGFRLVGGTKPGINLPTDVSMLILEYNTVTPMDIARYTGANLSTILYTSSNEWTFSLAWCQGAQVVISDDPQAHYNMESPCWAWDTSDFARLWCKIYALCVASFLIVHILKTMLCKSSIFR